MYFPCGLLSKIIQPLNYILARHCVIVARTCSSLCMLLLLKNDSKFSVFLWLDEFEKAFSHPKTRLITSAHWACITLDLGLDWISLNHSFLPRLCFYWFYKTFLFWHQQLFDLTRFNMMRIELFENAKCNSCKLVKSYNNNEMKRMTWKINNI